MNELVPADVFDADYLYFYDAFQTAELNDRETDLVVQLLGLSERNDLLDACSGAGRIANRLAVRGHRVTAIDTNAEFCELASLEAATLGVKVDHRCADIRKLDDVAAYDAIVCWFSSFGYWDDRTNFDVLRRFRRALRPGGQLLLDVANPALILRQLGAHGAPVQRLRHAGEGDVMRDELSVDLETATLQVQRHIERDGQQRDLSWAYRLYNAAELFAMLRRCGFGTSALLGDGGCKLHADSSRQLVLATAV